MTVFNVHHTTYRCKKPAKASNCCSGLAIASISACCILDAGSCEVIAGPTFDRLIQSGCTAGLEKLIDRLGNIELSLGLVYRVMVALRKVFT
jgi:hypothetical protein